MGVGAGLYMYDVVVKKFTFAISSPDEFLYLNTISLLFQSSTGDDFFNAVDSRLIPMLLDDSLKSCNQWHFEF